MCLLGFALDKKPLICTCILWNCFQISEVATAAGNSTINRCQGIDSSNVRTAKVRHPITRLLYMYSEAQTFQLYSGSISALMQERRLTPFTGNV